MFVLPRLLFVVPANAVIQRTPAAADPAGRPDATSGGVASGCSAAIAGSTVGLGQATLEASCGAVNPGP